MKRVAVILAAGRGTRMRSDLPKVLHQAGGAPLLRWPIGVARELGCERCVVVAGLETIDALRAAFPEPDLEWVLQDPPRGTGHALAVALAAVEEEAAVEEDAVVLVLSGDAPLLSVATARRLLEAAEAGFGALAVADMATPGSLGRVFTTADGGLARIVEAADASPQELEQTLVNAGFYAVPSRAFAPFLDRLEARNAQGELYLTDAVVAAATAGHRVEVVRLEQADEAFGVNSRADLARAHRALVERTLARLMAEGVTLLDPATTWVDADVQVGRDTVLHPGVTLAAGTHLGARCVVHTGAWLRGCEVADEVVVEPYSVLDGARVGLRCRVGPFARLRPGTVLEESARVGNFVEVKNSRLGVGAKAGHLAYLGDAEVGAHANIGAGVITCNFDGVSKHPTRIGAEAFIGSDTMLVAPVSVGERATTAAGSVITRPVPDDAIAIARVRQRIVLGWSKRRPRRQEE
jgi:bifunctional UDP-N-acetylglucosamine pyrophosphorylase/glucosamine-1-phosphate N-acetyltransferase